MSTLDQQRAMSGEYPEVSVPAIPNHSTDTALTLRQRAEASLLEQTSKWASTPLSQPTATERRTLHELQVHQIELEMQVEELREAKHQLEVAHQRYVDLFDLAPAGYCSLGENSVILNSNLTLGNILGFERAALINQRISNFIRFDDQDIYYLTCQKVKQTRQPQSCDLRMVQADGTELWIHLAIKVDEEVNTGILFRVVLSDITDRKHAEEKINELAYFDPLTRLPNRTLLLDRLRQATTLSARDASHGSLLFIDLDNFKTLNDTLGHDIGDLLLQQAALRIVASVREGDTVARLGGDEFVVVLGSLSEIAEEAATQTKAIGSKILAAFNNPYQLNTTEYRNTASIGATLFKGQLPSVDDLMKQADLAMYKSKQTGRNALHFFDPVMQTLLIERSALEANLRRAIEVQQFVLYYQAQVVDSGRVTGAEVLVRWLHPDKGMIPPAEFIALAEETGLILPLGQWVMRTACTQLAAWATQPEMAHLTVAVNVSAKEFGGAEFVANVLEIIQQTGANAKKLKLELTESLLVNNIEDVIDKMNALRTKGIGFSLDDFGTGYSSLSYLKRMPLDQLKIDQSFVRDVLVDPNDAAIARTIVALAQSLGLGVIAEGVETESQRAFLNSCGCHAYQGYLFSRPLPVDAFEALVRGR